MKNDVPQDITPPKKSIRNIAIPEIRRRGTSSFETAAPQDDRVIHDEIVSSEPEPLTIRRRAPRASEHTQEEYQYIHEEPSQPVRRVVSFDETIPAKPNRVLIIGSIAGIFILGSIFIFMSFGGATVTVFPKQITSTLKTELVATNTLKGATSTNQLLFSSTEFVAQATQEITATGEENVVTKAGGTITIYNEYSETEQRLVKNTRFATEDGKIFRIQEAVVVPGFTRDENGNMIPGTRITQVVADEPGKEYNVGATRFNIPGFEGLPQYSVFYAKSTGAMTGGFNGIKKIISDTDRNRAERELRETIKADLLSQANAKGDDETLVLVDDSLTTYETLDEVVEGNTVTLGMKGTTKGIHINTANLAYALAKQDLNSFKETDAVHIKNIDELRIRVFANPNDDALATVRIAVEGDGVFEWQLDEAAFKNALAGNKKETLATTVQQFSGITKAEASIRPIWNQTFSANPEKIKIINIKE